MQDAHTNLFLRNDTLLGVCEAIGQDFGFNPNWLRVALCLALFASPVGAVAAYFGLGIVVLASRLIFPSAKPGRTVEAAPAAEAANADADLPIAA